MAHKLIQTMVNINDYPDLDTHQALKDAELTIGDLHANALKFVYFLVRQGVLHISKVHYQQFVKIYNTAADKLTAKDLTTFKLILSKAKIKKNAKVRLIGDEVADRGMNDYFTLLIIKKLVLGKVQLDIVLSNHASEFIENIETKEKFQSILLDMKLFASSMANLQILIDKGLVKRAEILELVKKYYLPRLKVVDYQLDKTNNEITLFSHAPIDLECIKSLAKKFNVRYQDQTAETLAITIDNINAVFKKEYILKNKISSLFDSNIILLGLGGDDTDHTKYPVFYLMWNRLLEKLKRPFYYKGYKVNYVHGHDSIQAHEPNVYNLDNELGKYPDWHTRLYNILYFHPSILPKQIMRQQGFAFLKFLIFITGVLTLSTLIAFTNLANVMLELFYAASGVTLVTTLSLHIGISLVAGAFAMVGLNAFYQTVNKMMLPPMPEKKIESPTPALIPPITLTPVMPPILIKKPTPAPISVPTHSHRYPKRPKCR